MDISIVYQYMYTQKQKEKTNMFVNREYAGKHTCERNLKELFGETNMTTKQGIHM